MDNKRTKLTKEVVGGLGRRQGLAAEEFAHLQTAGRFAVLHHLLELGADESDFGDDAVDGHELVQVVATQSPGVEQLRGGGGGGGG